MTTSRVLTPVVRNASIPWKASSGSCSMSAPSSSSHSRNDALFAGDQGHRLLPDPLDDARIDLAREQAQRQADHPGGMGQHALDRVIGLAGIGRAKDGLDRLGG